MSKPVSKPITISKELQRQEAMLATATANSNETASRKGNKYLCFSLPIDSEPPRMDRSHRRFHPLVSARTTQMVHRISRQLVLSGQLTKTNNHFEKAAEPCCTAGPLLFNQAAQLRRRESCAGCEE